MGRPPGKKRKGEAGESAFFLSCKDQRWDYELKRCLSLISHLGLEKKYCSVRSSQIFGCWLCVCPLLDHHLDKLVVVDLSITIEVGLLDHLVDLFLRELFTKVGHDVSQLSGRDEAVSVLVKDLEGLHQLLLRIGVLHLLGHQTQELGEVNGAAAVVIDLVDYVVQLGLRGGLAKRTQDGAQLLGGDGSIAVLVEKQESLLEFGNLFVGELRGSSGIGHLPMLVLLLSVLFSTSSSARGLCFFFHESGLPSRLLFLRCAFSVCVCALDEGVRPCSRGKDCFALPVSVPCVSLIMSEYSIALVRHETFSALSSPPLPSH